MDLLAGWDRVRRNLVGTFFLQAKAEPLEREVKQPEEILLQRQTYFLPFTQLEREYQELAKLDDLLYEARENYKTTQKEFELRWHLCSKKNDTLNKFIANFEIYYAISKAKQEIDRKVNDQYDDQLYTIKREVNRLQKEVARLKELKVELERRLECSEIYREFMNSVIQEGNGEYDDISQVIARYYDLKDIRDRHVERTVSQVALAFQLQKELKEIVQLKEEENVAGKTYLTQLDDYKNQLQISNWRKHDNLLALKAGLKREILLTHTPQTGIYNLYVLLCDQMEQPVTLQADQFREQLQFIQKYMKELTKICDRTKEFLECPSNVPLVVSQKTVKSKHDGRTRAQQPKTTLSKSAL